MRARPRASKKIIARGRRDADEADGPTRRARSRGPAGAAPVAYTVCDIVVYIYYIIYTSRWLLLGLIDARIA